MSLVFHTWLEVGIVAFSAAPVLLLFSWCFSGSNKPAEVYDTQPDDDRLHQFRLEQFRRDLQRAQTDDEASDAIDWARYALGLGVQEIQDVLDEVKPLGSPDQKAALAVRAMFQLEHGY